MKKIFFKFLLVIDVLALVVFGVCSSLIERCHVATGVMTDGFGRILKPTPILVQFIFYMRNWAGFKWFITDTIIFWSLVFIGYILFQTIKDVNKE